MSTISKFFFTILFFLIFGSVSYGAEAAFEVSLTFDDARLSQYTYAAPALKDAGQKGTLYVPTGQIGTPGYMTWSNVSAMALAGWDIGGHSVTHAELPILSAADIEAEVAGSFETLEAYGFAPKSFASPYGAYNATVVAAIAKYYQSHRGYHDIEYNTWPYNAYLLQVQEINNQTTVAEVLSWIDHAEAYDQWLIIVFHEIRPTVDPLDTYTWSVADLENLLAAMNTRGITAKTVAEALNRKDSLLPNSDFDAGLADGWNTNAPASITFDVSTKGTGTTPETSLKIASGGGLVDLHSPIITVDPSQKYGVSYFVNPTEFISGEFGFYLDEYDSNGNWVSWQFLGIGDKDYTVDETFAYTPSSAAVAQAELSLYVSSNAQGNVYVDAVEIFEDGYAAPLPDPDPIPDPDDDLDELQALPFANSNFDAGIAEGWVTNSASHVMADSAGNGYTPTEETSIKFLAGSGTSHLFSPQALVDNTESYTLSIFADTTELTSGELGLYMDEYDAGGNWISGKWLGMTSLASTGRAHFAYQPSSSNVHSISLQLYLTAGIGIAFIDSLEVVITSESDGLYELLYSGAHSDDFFNEGWMTDTPDRVEIDLSGNGTSPTVLSSIKMTAGAYAAHLFSPRVETEAQVFEFNLYADTTQLPSGELGVYIDEYDAGGNWISGKWLGMFANGTVQTKPFSYSPTSHTVHTASLQVYVTAGEGFAYIDIAEIE